MPIKKTLDDEDIESDAKLSCDKGWGMPWSIDILPLISQ